MKNRLKQLRERHGMTQAIVGRDVGVSGQTVSLYETGQRNPNPATWQKLADYFDVSVPYLQRFDTIELTKQVCPYCDAVWYMNGAAYYCPMCGRKLV